MAKAAATGKKTYHHGDLRSALLDNTARILREEGENGLSFRRLAAHIGVSRTAPYHHFKDKQSLLYAVAEEGFSRFNTTMRAVLEQGRKQGGLHLTRDYTQAYVTFAVTNSEYYDLMYGGRVWRSDSLTQSLVISARATLRESVERLHALQRRGLIAARLDALRFAQVSWGAYHGISRLVIDGIYSDVASVTRICETAADMLWEQMKPD